MDQRATLHSQTLDYPAGERRHAFRLTPLANTALASNEDESNEECGLEGGKDMLALCCGG